MNVFQVGTPATLEGNNFANKPLIEMRLKAKLWLLLRDFQWYLHALCKQVNWVNSRLFLVKSQTASLTFDPSFGHNLCFRCPNEQCEPTLDIYVLRAFE